MRRLIICYTVDLALFTVEIRFNSISQGSVKTATEDLDALTWPSNYSDEVVYTIGAPRCVARSRRLEIQLRRPMR
jgi:hypothetical protein